MGPREEPHQPPQAWSLLRGSGQALHVGCRLSGVELHSEDEDRFIAIGPIARGVVLVVHTVHDDEDVLRIISARFASKRERSLFRAFAEAQ